LLGYDRKLDLALLDVKDSVGGISLLEDSFLRLEFFCGSPGSDRNQERLGINPAGDFRYWGKS
jgi:hypothetical protein